MHLSGLVEGTYCHHDTAYADVRAESLSDSSTLPEDPKDSTSNNCQSPIFLHPRIRILITYPFWFRSMIPGIIECA